MNEHTIHSGRKYAPWIVVSKEKIMFKSISIASILLVFLSIAIHAQIVKQPSMIQTLPTPEFPDPDPFNDLISAFFIQSTNNNLIQLHYFRMWVEPDIPGIPFGTIDLLHYRVATWNMETEEVIDFSEGDRDKFFEENSIEHNGNSVVIDERQLVLEDSQTTYFYNTDEYLEYHLDKAYLSPNEQRIGGLVLYSIASPEDLENEWFIMALWDSITGKTLYREIPSSPGYVPSDGPRLSIHPLSLELNFSPDGRFYFFRQGFFENPWGILPSLKLLDTKTLTLWEADRDVAFSSDMRYLVTEREGLPSLVDIESNTIIHQYQVESPMSACCFSQDDSQVYIATALNKLYIFESGLQSSAPCWEVY